jgi:hypothetical protein
LTLWDNDITDAGCIALCDLLRNNRKLLYLSLGRNKITDASLEYLAESLTAYKLTPQQSLERKKAIRELEKRKKEAETRKKRVAKGKAVKQASASPASVTTGATNAGSNAASNADAKSNAASGTSGKVISSPSVYSLKGMKSEEATDYDEMVESLQPIEETDGIAFGRGNRSLVHLNLTYNRASNAASLFAVKEKNSIIQQILIEGNPTKL